MPRSPAAQAARIQAMKSAGLSDVEIATKHGFGIVIGKGGESLKRIASEARQDMERLFGDKVYLEIWVKVKSGWNDDERLLKSLGYE